MPRFIKLTIADAEVDSYIGAHVWVNIDNITQMYKDDVSSYTWVELVGAEDCIKADETIDEILRLMPE